MLPVYWWRGSEAHPVRNFGDALNWTILTALEAEPAWRPVAQADLVVAGSVLEHLPKGWPGTVCGAGKLYEDSDVDLSAARVLAVRGHLTAKTKGVSKDVVVGDPGLLVPTWYRQPPARIELGVLPHWSDTELFKRFSYGTLIDPRQRPEYVVAQIAACKRIVSSSLHGLIVADAYGIPRQAELFAQAEREGGDFKFRDYASIYNTHPHFGEMWQAPRQTVARVQDELMTVLAKAVGKDLPQPVPDPKIPTLRNKRCPQVSILVAFRDDGEHRSRVWEWLRSYWFSQLDSVEIIQGHCPSWPFSKAQAINSAAERARGRVFVILDADAYMDAKVVQQCADDIEKAVRHGKRQWWMPYDMLYRLNREITYELLHTDPREPYSLPSPPPLNWLEDGDNTASGYGHKYGAMIQIMPREAFFRVGGMDTSFKGWGAEDRAMARSLDTLYQQHEMKHNDLCHLWHVRPGNSLDGTRRWVGEQTNGPNNSRRDHRYGMAVAEPAFMEGLVREHVPPKPRRRSFCCWFRQLWGFC